MKYSVEQEEVIYNIENPDYTPFNYYFILYDKDHIKKIEFNISTMSRSKKAQKSRKLRKTLPFTNEQFGLIWEMLGFR